MKKFILSLTMTLLCFAFFGVAKAQSELTVHEGDVSNAYVPVYGYYNDAYLKCEMVYPASELTDMQGGTIRSMTFYLSTPATDSWTGAYQVFLSEIIDNTISAFYGPDEIVYEGLLDGTSTEMMVEFETPYVYGGGNLLVGFYHVETGNYKSASFIGETVDGASFQGYSYSSLDAVNGSQRNFLPMTTFSYTPDGGTSCNRPDTFTVDNITENSAVLFFTGGSGNYHVEYKTASEEEWQVAGNTTSNNVALRGLQSNTAYQARVQCICSGNATSSWRTLSFNTLLCAPENMCEISYELHDSYGDGWNGNAIRVVDVETGATLATWTINSGSSASGTLAVCDGMEIRFEWVSGSYANETSYVVTSFFGEEIINGSNTMSQPVTYTVVCTLDPCQVVGLTAEPSYYSAAMTWNGSAPKYNLRYREVPVSLDPSKFHQVGSDVTTTSEMTQYTFNLNDYAGQDGYIAIRHYHISDMFRICVDDIALNNGSEDVFFVDFEGGVPEGWTNIDYDEDGDSWVYAYSSLTDDNGNYYYHSDSSFLLSASYINGYGAVTPDNWLISPLSQLGGTLTLWARGQDPSYAAEVFGVFVTTEELGAEEQPWTVVNNISGTSYVINGLNALTNYEAQVQVASSSCTDAEWSNLCQFTTLSDIIFVEEGYWNDASNWACGFVPAGNDIDVIIAAPAIIPAGYDALVNNVVFWEGGSITIQDGGQLHSNNNVLATIEKDITGYGGGNGYWNLISIPFWSTSPTPSTVTGLIPTELSDLDLYAFDGAKGMAEWRNHKETAISSFVFGKGYLYANANDATLQYTSELPKQFNNFLYINGGSTSSTLTFDEEGPLGSWNLVGNPLPHNGYIYLGVVQGSSVTVIPTAFYKMNPTGTDLIACDGSVTPMEAVFMQATAANQFAFISSASHDSKSGLNMNITQDGNLVDVALVRFGNGSCLEKLQLDPNHTRLSLTSNKKEFAVLYTEAQGQMPVNFKAQNNGTYTLNINPQDVAFEYLHLIDNLTGADIDLLAERSYTFKADVNDKAGRFTIVFTKESEPVATTVRSDGDSPVCLPLEGHGATTHQSAVCPGSCTAPFNITVVNLTNTTATISWNSEASEWRIKLNGSEIPESITDNPYTITGLNPATNYEIQVKAICDQGTESDWSLVTNFFTALCDPAEMCEITFELTDSYGDSWNGNAIEVVDVETGIVLATMANENLDGVNGIETQIVPLAVCEGREIEFRWIKGSYPGEASWVIYNINEEVICSGTGNTSMATGDVLGSYTVECTLNPCKIPTSLQLASSPTATSVELSWTPGTNDQNYWELCLNNDETNLYAATEIPFIIDGLDPETSYTVKVRANCGDFLSGWSNVVSFTTLEACIHPTSLQLGSFITDNSVELTWTVNDVEQDTWEICLNDDEAVIYTAYEVPYILEGLDPETSYTVKVRANCGHYLSSWSNVVSFTTFESCPDDKVCIGIVGTATSAYLPTHTYFKYALTEQIYTMEEIGYEPSGIASFDFFSTATERTRYFDIYMVETDMESFESNLDWVAVSAADLVFSGEVTFAQNAWTTINFDTPFEYTAQHNVLLVVDDNTGSYVTGSSFRVFDAPSQALYIYSDGTNYDPTAPSGGSVLSKKNQVRLSLTPISCFKPSEVTLSDTTATSITVNCFANDNEVFDVRYALSSGEPEWTILTEVTSPAVIGNLMPETNYMVQVRTNCGGGDVSNWTGSYTFTTGQIPPMPIIDGWNWIGSPIEFHEGSLNELREALLSVANEEDAITIKSQTQYTTYQNGNWFGGLTALDNAEMYMIEAETTITDWQFTGNPLNPEDHPITINPGWNWIPYLGNYEVSLEDALSNMTIYDYDIIKVKGSHAMWAMYMNGQWDGDPSFKSMNPGLGYMFFSNTDESFQFTYPTNIPPFAASGSKGVTTFWKSNEKDFPTNLTMAVTVDLPGSDLTQGNYEIGAFVNGECRGAARLVNFNGTKMAFLTVSGEDGDNVIFKLYDADADYVFADAALERVSYKADDVYGDPLAPMTLHFAVTNVAEADNTVAIFPNPTNDKLYVSANDIQSVKVFNAMGQCLSAQEFDHATQVELNLGAYSAGVYTVAVRTHNGQLINKMVVRQ